MNNWPLSGSESQPCLSNPKIQALGFQAAAVWLFKVRKAQTGKTGILQEFTEAWIQRVCHCHAQQEPKQKYPGAEPRTTRCEEHSPEDESSEGSVRKEP